MSPPDVDRCVKMTHARTADGRTLAAATALAVVAALVAATGHVQAEFLGTVVDLIGRGARDTAHFFGASKSTSMGIEGGVEFAATVAAFFI